MNDIIPPERRSIRNVPINKKKTSKKESTPRVHRINTETEVPIEVTEIRDTRKVVHEETRRVERQPEPETHYSFEDPLETERRHHSLFFYIAAIAIPILVIAIGLGVYSLTWSGADVVVTPKTQTVTLSISSSSLPYTVITKTAQGSVDVAASGQETVSAKASGQIIVYNVESTAPQKLIANTRFETSAGKVYRIKDALTIPGRTGSAASPVAGSAEATVYADAAGESYNNSALTDFTIPGFKGDPRYKTVYARSKTPMTGGFSGTRSKVSDADLRTKVDTLVASLKDTLVATVASSSVDTVAFPSGTFFEQREVSRDEKDATKVTITEAVDAHIFVFGKADLSQFIIDQVALAGSKEGAFVRDFSSLTLELPARATWTTKNPLLVLKGNVTVVWYYSAEKLAEDLAGLPKDDAKTVLAKYLGIQTAESIVRPFWKSTFPDDPQKIHVTENSSI